LQVRFIESDRLNQNQEVIFSFIFGDKVAFSIYNSINATDFGQNDFILFDQKAVRQSKNFNKNFWVY